MWCNVMLCNVMWCYVMLWMDGWMDGLMQQQQRQRQRQQEEEEEEKKKNKKKKIWLCLKIGYATFKRKMMSIRRWNIPWGIPCRFLPFFRWLVQSPAINKMKVTLHDLSQWIGFVGKNPIRKPELFSHWIWGFPVIFFPLNQSIESKEWDVKLLRSHWDHWDLIRNYKEYKV